jgi:hypothetical protein
VRDIGIEKVISGGQIGADIAALRAASRLGIPTGGWCPAGCKTRVGRNPKLVTLYRLREHPSPQYPPRTFANVKEADATVRFAHNFDSPGEKCTLKAIRKYGRPYLDVHLTFDHGRWHHKPRIKEIRQWLRDHDVRTLNVAGNADEETEIVVEILLTKVLS